MFSHTSRLLTAVLIAIALTIPVRAQTSVVAGDPFPDFWALDHNSQPFQLSSHRGKLVLLHFCTMWCGPCVNSAQNEAALARTLDELLGADNWLLVDVLVENAVQQATDVDDAVLWRSHLHTPAVTLHSDGTRALEDFAIELGINAFPTYFIVGPDGIVGDVLNGFSTNQILANAVANVADNYFDTEPPAIPFMPDVSVEAAAAPVSVPFAIPEAVDTVDGVVPVSCQPLSGGLFPFGTSRVICTATDTAGHAARRSFDVTVRVPATPGFLTTPGNIAKPLSKVDPGQSIRIIAGGFAPGAVVDLLFTSSEGVSHALGTASSANTGQIDVRMQIPNKIPGGPSQITALSEDASGAPFIRAWLVTVDKGPK